MKPITVYNMNYQDHKDLFSDYPDRCVWLRIIPLVTIDDTSHAINDELDSFYSDINVRKISINEKPYGNMYETLFTANKTMKFNPVNYLTVSNCDLWYSVVVVRTVRFLEYATIRLAFQEKRKSIILQSVLNSNKEQIENLRFIYDEIINGILGRLGSIIAGLNAFNHICSEEEIPKHHGTSLILNGVTIYGRSLPLVDNVQSLQIMKKLIRNEAVSVIEKIEKDYNIDLINFYDHILKEV